MPEIRDRMINDPTAPPEVKELPDFQWEASAETMARFLALLERDALDPGSPSSSEQLDLRP